VTVASWALTLMFLGFACAGFFLGWSARNLTIERRLCTWCDQPTVTPRSAYCRRHLAEIEERLRAEGLSDD
jgi:hypothetical protein